MKDQLLTRAKELVELGLIDPMVSYGYTGDYTPLHIDPQYHVTLSPEAMAYIALGEFVEEKQSSMMLIATGLLVYKYFDDLKPLLPEKDMLDWMNAYLLVHDIVTTGTSKQMVLRDANTSLAQILFTLTGDDRTLTNATVAPMSLQDSVHAVPADSYSAIARLADEYYSALTGEDVSPIMGQGRKTFKNAFVASTYGSTSSIKTLCQEDEDLIVCVNQAQDEVLPAISVHRALCESMDYSNIDVVKWNQPDGGNCASVRSTDWHGVVTSAEGVEMPVQGQRYLTKDDKYFNGFIAAQANSVHCLDAVPLNKIGEYAAQKGISWLNKHDAISTSPTYMDDFTFIYKDAIAGLLMDRSLIKILRQMGNTPELVDPMEDIEKALVVLNLNCNLI